MIDIVPERRIVSAGTMHQNGVLISPTPCTFEFTGRPAGGT
jgi:hypothetical protein